MAKYQITHTCGHVGTHQIYGPSRDRSSRESWLEGTLCSECYQAELARKRAEEAKVAAAEAGELGLPELAGSEKQVAWAERLRAEFVRASEAKLAEMPVSAICRDRIDASPFVASLPEGEAREFARRLASGGDLHEPAEFALRSLLYAVIAEQPSAHWWIDSRDVLTSRLLTDALRERAWAALLALRNGQSTQDLIATEQRKAAEAEAERQGQSRLEAAATEESTVRPESPVTPLVAEIAISSGAVVVRFPERSDALLEVVHRFDSKWDGGEHQIAWFQPTEVAVEVAHRLLHAGIPICLQDPELRRRAVAGEYTPWTGRRLGAAKNDAYFMLFWRREEDWYDPAKRLPGARWDRDTKVMRVPPDAWREAEDFAVLHGFAVTPAAERFIADRREIAASVLPQPVGPVPAAPDPADCRPALSSATPEVPEHLREDR